MDPANPSDSGEKRAGSKTDHLGGLPDSPGNKGEADAKATAIFASAFSIDPEFYSFTKTLEIYNEALGKDSELILSTDSEFFKYLKGYSENP